MTSYDAQTALNAIHHRQEQTRDEYMRHAYSRPYVLISALGLFAVCASFDLPSRWGTAAVLIGNGLTLGGLFVHQRRAPARRKCEGREVLFLAAIGALGVTLFWTVAVAAYFLDLPARHTIAAAVSTLACVAGMYALRPAVKGMIRRDGHG
ncbi:hypothetical protein [Streptomyces sp. WM6378]|uniref:hypothetical protein n=1 Tax=Streptomyces sp. WM6378 TaxID=1415557 RepID=UPI0006AF94CF|nr:hypothetical protein [Streptomyces sp. WM6378]KOU33752.1 hypothetical protein ADK54_41625 [Streptomyces sp. WM6378]